MARASAARFARANAAAALLAAMAAQCAPGAARASDDVSVETRRRGPAVEVSASATLHAPIGLVWRTLTDYDHLSEFIPGMRSSRLVERRGAEAIVEQVGEARFLFFALPIDVTLSSMEYPPHAVKVHLLKGNLRQLDGGYRIERPAAAEPDTLVLRWDGVIEHEQGLPPLFGEALMRANVASQFGGMVREIERRAMLRRAAHAEGRK